MCAPICASAVDGGFGTHRSSQISTPNVNSGCSSHWKIVSVTSGTQTVSPSAFLMSTLSIPPDSVSADTKWRCS